MYILFVFAYCGSTSRRPIGDRVAFGRLEIFLKIETNDNTITEVNLRNKETFWISNYLNYSKFFYPYSKSGHCISFLLFLFMRFCSICTLNSQK